MESTTQVQILNKAVYFSHSTNSLNESRESSYTPPAMID